MMVTDAGKIILTNYIMVKFSQFNLIKSSPTRFHLENVTLQKLRSECMSVVFKDFYTQYHKIKLEFSAKSNLLNNI